MTINLILLILAALSFAIAAFGSVLGFTNSKINLIALGLLLWVLTQII